ncbi:MAG: manganese efflux pump MntP family protein [Myxococcales bacterium]|jgi:putative Mn2+ efflux pump MntP
MGLPSLLAIAVALAMDAFAVAIVSGIALNPLSRRHVFRLSFHFGLFQALMPVIGWVAGRAIHRYIAAFDHWIAFGLLALVGGRMVLGALRADEGKESERTAKDPTRGWTLVMLSVATSIDALAVGLSLAMVGTGIVFPALVIGVVAAGFTVVGMVLGRRVGMLAGQWVEVAGGFVLIGIGVKIVVEHLYGG